MRHNKHIRSVAVTFCVALMACWLVPCLAQPVSPEDEPIPDIVPPSAPPTAKPGPNVTPTPTVEGVPIPDEVAPRTQPEQLITEPESAVPASQGMEHSMETEDQWKPEREQSGGAAPLDFMRQALYAGVLVALMCSYLGIYVVLKRIVFVGVALAEMSSAGIALALLLGFAPLLGAFGFMLLGVLLFSIHWSPRRVPHDSYIGILYALAGALSVLLIAKSPQGESHMLTLLQGNVLTVAPRETLEMLAVFAVVALLHTLFYKVFVLVAYDRESAATQGFRAGAWDMLLFLTIGTVISLSIRSVGVLMTSSMLIMPAATALLLSSRLRHAMLMAPLFGVLPVLAGLHLSFVADLPTSAVIVALSFLLLLPALFYALTRKYA